jgi:type IV pilus assembly protein PilA
MERPVIERIRKSTTEKDKGFTLVELLVVVVIIGVLAAIAIPMYLNQQKKAHNAAAEADAKVMSTELATWFIDNTAVPTLATTGGRWTLTAGTTTVEASPVSDGVELVGKGIAPGSTATTWSFCVKNKDGSGSYKASATDGVDRFETKDCTGSSS